MQDKNTEIIIFSSRLRERMKCYSLTQNQLGEMSNISQSTISSYLIGRTAPRSDELYRLSNALGVTMDWLWGESESEQNSHDAQLEDLTLARQEIARLRNKLKSATQTLEGAYKLALEALKLEEEGEKNE